MEACWCLFGLSAAAKPPTSFLVNPTNNPIPTNITISSFSFLRYSSTPSFKPCFYSSPSHSCTVVHSLHHHPHLRILNSNDTSSSRKISKKRIALKPKSKPKLNSSSSSSSSLSSSSSAATAVNAQQKQQQRGEDHEKEGYSSSPSAISVRTVYQNGDPVGRKDLGKGVVRWICQGMKAMASDFASAEVQGEFWEVRQRMGTTGLNFVIQAQPYLNAIPMPQGLEAICLKARTHYPTLFDHFQRELRDVLQDLQRRSILSDWRKTQSWLLLKELASSAQHRAIVRKVSQSKPVHSGLGMDLQKAKIIQQRIDDFAKQMSDLLRIERDAELEFTQEELDAAPTLNETSDLSKPVEYLVSHGQAQQEQCDTICNLRTVSSSTGLGGMHLVLFRAEGNHRLPPTSLSPGDMVCVRTCDSRGAGATSCMQGFVHNLGEDGCSISVALESSHGDPTFSKLFGKSVRIDRIHGLADVLTYEV
ncbi:hypothetical protein ACLOJK_041736 [Asimina triloba]